MKKIETLNNAQKTVLKLEKEINAISNNLSKVKNKDHTTMKKIINNINYLLAKDEYEKIIYKNEISEEKEENKQFETKNKINQINENIPIYDDNNRNIDYLLMINKQKNNNSGNNCSNKPYFNRKCISSSKININNISEEKKLLNIYSTRINCDKKDNNTNRNANINFSNNVLNKTNQMAYSKPRLLTEYSKRNSNNNIMYKNNTFNKNKKNEEPIKNVKFLTLNEKANNSYKNKNKHKKSSILNTLYYNYRDNSENNFLNNNKYLKENSKNKIAYSFDQPEIMYKKKDKNLNNLYEKEKKKNEYGFKKNNKLISEKKLRSNHYIELNSYNKSNLYSNSTNKYHYNNIYNNINFPCLSFEDEDLNKNNISEKNIKRGKNNYIFPYDENKSNDNLDNFNKEDFNLVKNNKTQRNIKNNNYFNQNYSKSFNSYNLLNNSNINGTKNNNNNNIIFNDKDKIEQLLNMLNVKNINEGILKVNSLLKYEKDINKLKELYEDNNCENYKFNTENMWLSNIIKNYKRNEKYKNYCQNIMILYKIKNFADFKIFIKNLLQKNKNHKNFHNTKIGLYVDENYSNNNINSNNNKTIIPNKRKNIISKDNEEGINFSNLQNFKIITDYMNTNY